MRTSYAYIRNVSIPMLFTILIRCSVLSLVFLVVGLIAGRSIARISRTSESFADEARVLKDSTHIDTDFSDGNMTYLQEISYGKQAVKSVSLSYTTKDMAIAWNSGDTTLKLAVVAIVCGLVGMVVFPGLAFLADNNT